MSSQRPCKETQSCLHSLLLGKFSKYYHLQRRACLTASLSFLRRADQMYDAPSSCKCLAIFTCSALHSGSRFVMLSRILAWGKLQSFLNKGSQRQLHEKLYTCRKPISLKPPLTDLPNSMIRVQKSWTRVPSTRPRRMLRMRGARKRLDRNPRIASSRAAMLNVRLV